MTPQEYAVRAVRAWVTNLDLDTVPELRTNDPTEFGERRDLFVKQVLDAAEEMVGPLVYSVIAERQDEEWQHLQHAVDQGELEPVSYPVRFTAKGEVVR